MNYESVILELMSRIKVLETRCDELEVKVEDMNTQQIAKSICGEETNLVPRQKMTEKRTKACYECGVSLYKNSNLNFNEELAKLVESTGMNYNSAVMYVYAVKNMLNGEVYKRAISQTATEKFFQYILRDFGADKQKAAIRATREHIAYRQSFGHIVNGLIELCDRYS